MAETISRSQRSLRLWFGLFSIVILIACFLSWGTGFFIQRSIEQQLVVFSAEHPELVSDYHRGWWQSSLHLKFDYQGIFMKPIPIELTLEIHHASSLFSRKIPWSGNLSLLNLQHIEVSGESTWSGDSALRFSQDIEGMASYDSHSNFYEARLKASKVELPLFEILHHSFQVSGDNVSVNLQGEKALRIETSHIMLSDDAQKTSAFKNFIFSENTFVQENQLSRTEVNVQVQSDTPNDYQGPIKLGFVLNHMDPQIEHLVWLKMKSLSKAFSWTALQATFQTLQQALPTAELTFAWDTPTGMIDLHGQLAFNKIDKFQSVLSLLNLSPQMVILKIANAQAVLQLPKTIAEKRISAHVLDLLVAKGAVSRTDKAAYQTNFKLEGGVPSLNDVAVLPLLFELSGDLFSGAFLGSH